MVSLEYGRQLYLLIIIIIVVIIIIIIIDMSFSLQFKGEEVILKCCSVVGLEYSSDLQLH